MYLENKVADLVNDSFNAKLKGGVFLQVVAAIVGKILKKKQHTNA